MDLRKQIYAIANRIHATREILGLSEEEMATATGMSIEEYQKCELSKKDLSVTFIYKCAEKFGIDPTELINGVEPTLTNYAVTRKDEGLPISSKEYTAVKMAQYFKHKIAEPYFVNMPWSKEEEEGKVELVTHIGQEFMIVISGTARVQIGDNIEILNEGDTMYYNSGIPHGVTAIGGVPCQFYTMILRPDPSTKVDSDFGLHFEPRKIPEEKDTVSTPFIKTTHDENGLLKKIDFTNADSFNFGFDVVDAIADKNPEKLAMLHISREHEERRFTFGELKLKSNMAANYFLSLGIKKGDKVMLVLKRHYQFWICMVALHKIGAISIPATNLLTERDFIYRFNAAGVKVLICTGDGSVSDEAVAASKNCNEKPLLIMANGEKEGFLNFDADYIKHSDRYERTSDTSCGEDPILMFFTSGTTSYPKIAEHNHKYGLGHYITAKYWHNVNPDGIHFTISDTGWGKAVWGKFYGQWLCEAAVFTYDFDKFNAHDLLVMFKKYNITTFCAPPTMFRFFIKEDLSKYDLSSLEHSTVAGEALNPEVYEQWKKATGLSLMEGFGQTETTLAVYNPVGTIPKPGSMGVPSPLYDMDIVFPDGTSAPVGETGEIVIKLNAERPCGLFIGYHNDPEKNAEAHENGMYHTGDTAWKDETGNYWYVGRMDDLIKSSGYRIGPFEIESVIMELPYVLECAVTPVPDPLRGQIVKATVVLTNGTQQTEELKKDIQEYVKTHTAPYKYPRIVEFRDSLPKTISGKIRRVELRADDENTDVR